MTRGLTCSTSSGTRQRWAVAGSRIPSTSASRRPSMSPASTSGSVVILPPTSSTSSTSARWGRRWTGGRCRGATTKSTARRRKTKSKLCCRRADGWVSPIRCSSTSRAHRDDCVAVGAVSRRAPSARLRDCRARGRRPRAHVIPMRGTAIVTAAAETHPGLHRANNEDRVHADPVRGIFAVIDGVGGHAAGEKAADTALAMLRARLERETGAIEDRVREAIAVAATEIHRQAALRPEWHGMTCVLTVAVLDEDGSMVIGHVGDTRMYKVRNGTLVKLTRDHSPVGEREDAGELSESAAMSHPRRNEVYRDVGSEPRSANDADFIDIIRAPFEPDAAILLCSDGLTDYVPSEVILRTLEAHRGRPQEAALALIDAANAAGGKDNISVVYAEGPAIRGHAEAAEEDISGGGSPPTSSRAWLPWALLVASWAAVALAAFAYWGRLPVIPLPSQVQPSGPIEVREGGSIAAALASAAPGSVVIVAPGEYRERLTLRPGVEVRSATARGAVLRLPAGASESDPAVLGADVTAASL